MQSHFSIPALLAVAGGGAAGSLARYVIGTMVQRTPGFPTGTLAVNVSGSFVLGLLVTWFVTRAPAPELRLLLTIGLCGGYTNVLDVRLRVGADARGRQDGASRCLRSVERNPEYRRHVRRFQCRASHSR